MQNQSKRIVIRKNVRKRNNNARARQNPNKLVVLTDEGRFSPNTLVLKMRWGDQTSNRGNVSSNAANFNIRSSAYDPDPSFGTGAIPGFAEKANEYESYCVHKMKVRCEFGNHEINPIVVGMLPSNLFINTNSLGRSDCIEYMANANGTFKMLGAANSGTSVRTLTCVANGRDLLSRRLFTDLDFTAATNTNPLALFYVNYFMYVPSTANFAYNVDMAQVITYTVEFFDRRVLES